MVNIRDGSNVILQCSISFQESYVLKVSMAIAKILLRQMTRFRKTVSGKSQEEQSIKKTLTIVITPKQLYLIFILILVFY